MRLTKKKLLIISGVLVLVFAGITILMSGNKEEPFQAEYNKVTAPDSTIVGLNTLDLADLFPDPDENIEPEANVTIDTTDTTPPSYIRIGEAVYAAINNQVTNPKKSYSISVRAGTFTVKTVNGISSGSFLVDIPELKRTYKVAIEYDTVEQFSSVYVLCPTPAELTYPPIACSEAE